MQIIKDSDPYILDYISDPKKKIPALTNKNARFIKAILKLDSNYAKDLNGDPPDPDYDPKTRGNTSNSKYYGSTKYWFDEMNSNNSRWSFDDCVLGAIIAIDIVNSTHLEASFNGRNEMKKIICRQCKNVSDLKGMLNQNITNNNHLISLLSDNIKMANGRARYNLSFATKFCSSAAKYLQTNIQYPKYDKIVSDALPTYMKYYMNKDLSKNHYKIINQKNISKLDNRMTVYSEYYKDIDAIVNLPCVQQESITIDDLDQIIWYAFKG